MQHNCSKKKKQKNNIMQLFLPWFWGKNKALTAVSKLIQQRMNTRDFEKQNWKCTSHSVVN